MAQALSLTSYSEAGFREAMDREAYARLPNTKKGKIERARRLFVLMQMSFGGQQDSFSRTKSRTRRGIADVVSGYLSTIHDELPAVVERVLEWQIEQRDCVDCIRYHDGINTLFYIDPTYHPECRSPGPVYVHEMTHADHVRTLDCILECQGRVVISHYDHPLYVEKLQGWTRTEIDIANHAAGGKSKRRMIECLWRNY